MFLILAEIAFVLAFVAGVALISIPAALMVVGIAGVLAIERASVARKVKQ